MTTMYYVDDEFGNLIPTDSPLESYDAALQVARPYLAEHDDAPMVTIYTDDESWDVPRAEVLG